MQERPTYAANLLQHLMMCAIGIKRNWPHLLIIEDDVVPTAFTANHQKKRAQTSMHAQPSQIAMAKIVSEAPADYDALIVGICKNAVMDNLLPNSKKVYAHTSLQAFVLIRRNRMSFSDGASGSQSLCLSTHL